MKVWKDKEGNKLTAKEFTQRFKEGINNITPVQKLQNESRSSFTMLVGYIVGLISLIIYRESFAVQWFTYALIIIFLGATWSNGIKWLVLRQQVKQFKGMEDLNLDTLFQKIDSESEEVKGGTQ
jgi:hypothetical protein